MLKAIFKFIWIQASLLSNIPKHNKHEDTNGNNLVTRLLQKKFAYQNKNNKRNPTKFKKKLLCPSWMPVHRKHEEHFHTWDVINIFIPLCLPSRVRTHTALFTIHQPMHNIQLCSSFMRKLHTRLFNSLNALVVMGPAVKEHGNGLSCQISVIPAEHWACITSVPWLLLLTTLSGIESQ